MFFENYFSGGATCQKRPKITEISQLGQFSAIFLRNQKAIQLDVFHQEFKLTTSFEILLGVQGVTFSKKRPKLA